MAFGWVGWAKEIWRPIIQCLGSTVTPKNPRLLVLVWLLLQRRIELLDMSEQLYIRDVPVGSQLTCHCSGDTKMSIASLTKELLVPVQEYQREQEQESEREGQWQRVNIQTKSIRAQKLIPMVDLDEWMRLMQRV
jgi:hypothetical protein